MIPIVYCSFFNYATGDDMHYANLTHQVIVNHGTVSEFISGSIDRMLNFYRGWGGNWSAALLWTIEPSIWGEEAYHICLYISLLFILGGMFYFFFYFYQKYIDNNKIAFASAFLLLSFITIQGMPVGRSAFFWYSVIANYIFPYGVMLLCAVWLHRLISTGKIRYSVYATLGMIFIGGAGYMTIVVAFEMMILYLIYVFARKTDKTVRLKGIIGILIPLIAFFISFYFNFKAPGNTARGGEVMDFALTNLLGVIPGCIVTGTKTAIEYVLKGRLLIIYIPLMILLSWDIIDEGKVKCSFRWPAAIVIVGYLIYCSTFAPMVFMKNIIGSSGHTNSYWLVFVVVITFSIFYIVGYFKCRKGVVSSSISSDETKDSLGESENSMSKASDLLTGLQKKQAETIYRIGCLVLILASFVFYKHLVGRTFAYVCYDFVKTGQLADYEEQMQEKFRLLNDPMVSDVVVPFMNSEQGPYLHFANTVDPEDYTNLVMADFYGKNSVRGIPREQFERGEY